MTALTWYEPAAVRSRCTRAHEPTSTRVRRNRSASSYLQSLQRPIPAPALPRVAPPFPPRRTLSRALYRSEHLALWLIARAVACCAPLARVWKVIELVQHVAVLLALLSGLQVWLHTMALKSTLQ